jgi:hypothetical protein
MSKTDVAREGGRNKMTTADKSGGVEMVTLVFGNHAPVRVSASRDREIYDYYQEWGHRTIRIIRGNKIILYTSYNSGESHGGHSPRTTRSVLGVYADESALIASLRGGIIQSDCGGTDWSVTGSILEDIDAVEPA